MFQDLPPLADLPLENQRVLVRVDLDAPVDERTGVVTDDARLSAVLPTLQQILASGARLVVAGHRQPPRPGAPAPSLEPIAARLAELGAWEVHLPDECTGDAARKVVADLRGGQVCCLENLLGEPGEVGRDEAFARELARLADVYVLDSLTLAHLSWSSVTQLPRAIGQRAMGPTLGAELALLARLVTQPAHPLVAIVGGESFEAALPMIAALRARADAFCFAGGVGHALLAAEDAELGRTAVDPALLPQARTLLAQLRESGRDVLLPTDLVVASAPDAVEGQTVSARAVPRGNLAVDLGAETVERYRTRCSGAGTVLWIGSVGLPTCPAAGAGGRLLATSLAVSGAFTALVGEGPARAARSAGQPVVARLGLVTEAEATVRAALLGQRLPALEALA